MSVEIFYMTVDEAKGFGQKFFEEKYPERYARAGRFKFDEDRWRSLGVGALLYKELGLEESDLVILEHGKPHSKKLKRSFSISHSGEYIVLAVNDASVGVDIEKKKPVSDALVKRITSPEEYAWCMESLDDRFIRLWTMKEAVSKLFGKGLLMDFKGFDVLKLISGEYEIIDGLRLKGDQFIKDEYCVSVCFSER